MSSRITTSSDIFTPILTFFRPIGEKITLLRATGEKLEPTEEQLARRIDIPVGGLAIPNLSNITTPQAITGIGIGTIIVVGIVLFLVFRK